MCRIESKMVLRQRKRVEGIEKVVQELDAFPKVPEDYVEQTASGASGNYSDRIKSFS